MKPVRRFFYGASYSPLIFPENEWEHDLALMQQAGMNLIRLGDVHASWDRIEPEEGIFAFEPLGRFYQAAEEHQIDIIISTGASSPPLWLARKYPDLPLLSNTGTRYPLGASYHWACISHPDYRKALQDYIGALLDFTAHRPNHFGWQITNEIGFPFLPAREEATIGLYCYCDHCAKRFRDWTKEKYQSPQAVTHAWSWGTTNFVYNDWEDVFPPESMPSAWAGVTKWIDWRLFWQESFAEFAGWQHQMIRKKDHDHPTSINTFNFKGYDRFGTLMGLDQWQIAKQVDHIGYDLYPGSGNKLASRPEHISIFLDHGRSVAQTTGRDFWLHEVESGPIGGWVMGPDYNTSAPDVTNYVIESLGHDAKLLLYMPWREWDYQPLHWGALVDLDGAPTPRYEAARQLGTFIQANQDFLMKAHVPQSRVAILESKANAIFFRGIDQEEQLFTAQRGAYSAFWEAGYSVDFVTPQQIVSGTANPYRLIVLPMIGLIDPAAAESLTDFVQRGGILVGFARCGTLNESGWYQHPLPIPGLQKAFGIQQIEPDLLNGNKILFNEKSFEGWWNRDLVQPFTDTKILAEFTDHQPAITMSNYGSGHGIYIATQADAGHLKTSSSILSEMIQQTLPALGIVPQFDIRYSQKKTREIDLHILETDTRKWLLLSNQLKSAADVNISLKLHNTSVASVQRIWPKKQPLDWSSPQNVLSLSFNLDPQEVSIIEIVAD